MAARTEIKTGKRERELSTLEEALQRTFNMLKGRFPLAQLVRAHGESHDVTGSIPVWNATQNFKAKESSAKEVSIMYPEGSTEQESKAESLSASERNVPGQVTFFSFPPGTPRASCLGQPLDLMNDLETHVKLHEFLAQAMHKEMFSQSPLYGRLGLGSNLPTTRNENMAIGYRAGMGTMRPRRTVNIVKIGGKKLYLPSHEE